MANRGGPGLVGDPDGGGRSSRLRAEPEQQALPGHHDYIDHFDHNHEHYCTAHHVYYCSLHHHDNRADNNDHGADHH